MSTERALLYKKVEIVSNEIGKMEQDGTNSFSRYSYITHEAVTTAIRPLLKKEALSLVFEMEDYSERDYVDGKGKTVIRSVVKIVAVLTDTETGHQERLQFFGAEQDSGGKSMQQAITQATKYCMFKLFKITSKEEKDPDGKTANVVKEKARPASKAKTKAEAKVKTLAEWVKDARACNNPNALKTLWTKTPQAIKKEDAYINAIGIRGKGFEEKAKEMKTFTVKSGSKNYTVTIHNKNGINCNCKANGDCHHIQSVKDNLEYETK